ncbi:solute carrier family 22 member 1-like [Tigriopus californicus]|uniref:solute carrier family 22 member 1-like n=1 Tax=Tigriopus californicus TaxID=6832 RepID=UPI0027DA4BF5|nr:solute carrier family 22 member 1-like [Tigriopus californicus]
MIELSPLPTLDKHAPGASSKDETMAQLSNFEDLLTLVGGWSRYQKTVLGFFFIICMFLAYATYTPILFLYTPDHHCSVDHIWNVTNDQTRSWSREELANMIIPFDEVTGKRSSCLIYDIPSRQLTQVTKANITNFPTTKCTHGWTYNITGLFSSAINEMDWVCDDAWRGPFSQSMFSMGAIFGKVVFGYVADSYGRLAACYASNILLMLAGLATPFFTDFIGFISMRFLQGIAFDTFFAVFYVLALECVAANKRALIGNLALALGMTVAGCFEPWALYFLKDWKILNTILYAQVVVIMLAPWFVFESIRWLASQGRIDDAFETLLKIGKVNEKEVHPDLKPVIMKILSNEQIDANGEASTKQKQAILWDLFKTPNMRKNFILMVIVFMFTHGLFDMNVRIIGNLEQSIFITFTISAFLELPADLLAIVGLDWIGRRWSAFLSLILSGIAMLTGALLTSYPIALLIMTMIGRLCVTYALNTVFNICLEIVPTVVRGQGMAMAKLLADLAIFTSPYVVFTGSIHMAIPFIIIGVLSILSGILAVFLPETADEHLPDTMEDGEAFGRNQDFWNVPILKRLK